VFGTQVFDRQRIRNVTGIESMSWISDDDQHCHGAYSNNGHYSQIEADLSDFLLPTGEVPAHACLGCQTRSTAYRNGSHRRRAQNC